MLILQACIHAKMAQKHDFITFDLGFSGKFRISQVCDKNRGVRTKLSPNDKCEKGRWQSVNVTYAYN